MSPVSLHIGWTALASLMLFAVAVEAFARGEVLRFDLDGTAQGTIAGKTVNAQLGDGAKFVEGAEGRGVEPAEGGFAVQIPAGDALAQQAGTLAFAFRLSRTDRFDPKSRRKITLVDSPALRIEYSAARLYLSVPCAKVRTEPRRIQFTHFKGDKWYHLAVAWDAARGTMDVYLNGARQEYSPEEPWEFGEASGPLRLGGSAGEMKIAIDSVQVFATALSEQQLAEALEGRSIDPPDYEGRMSFSGPINLGGRRLTLLYEADFTKPLAVINEGDLFRGPKRIGLPQGADWVLEGAGKAWTQDGRLHIKHATDADSTVLWNTQRFPADFLLEFAFAPSDPQQGLTIIFFAATGLDGGGVFDLDQRRRDGEFPNYHSSSLRCYHISYWATAPDGVGFRGTSNLRKNPGHRLVAIGDDHIAGAGAGPHKVRLCKIGGKIQLETNGKLSVVWEDDGKTLGAVLGGGYIALRQMRHTRSASYTHFKLFAITPAAK